MSRHLALAAAVGGSARPAPIGAVILGPNARLAVLRVLVERVLATSTAAWQWIRQGTRLIARTPRWVGHSILGILSSDAGYETAVRLIGSGVKASGKGIDIAVCATGRTVAVASGAVAAMIAKAAPRWGGKLVEAHADAVDTTNRAYSTIQARMSDTGQRLERLAHGPIARTISTRAAAIASAFLAVHAISRGVIATKILHAAPALTGAVAAATSPWVLLAGVAVVTASALAWQALRSSDTPPMTGPLTVNVQRDGSVIVTGMPDQLSQADKQQAAKEAVDQAVQHMEATIRRRTRAPRRTGRTG